MKTARYIYLSILLALLPLAANAVRLDSVASMRHMAMLSYEGGNYRQAIECYNKVLALGDHSVFPYYNMACCYGRIGNADSAKFYLQKALDHGYMGYIEMTMDNDLRLLQSKPCWLGLYQQARDNASGKTLKEDFNDNIGTLLIKQDTTALLGLVDPKLRNKNNDSRFASALAYMNKECRFAGIRNSKQLMQYGKLVHKEVKYTDGKYVCNQIYDFVFPINVSDRDFAMILAETTVHLHTKTIDDTYSYLDSISFTDPHKNIDLGKIFATLTDSVMVLTLTTDKSQANHYEEKRAKSDFDIVDQVLQKAEVIDNSIIPSSLSDTALCFVRLANLPLVKGEPFKGIKIAFANESDEAIVVYGNEYCYMKSEKLKKLLKFVAKLVN